jgi:hypothetical protein
MLALIACAEVMGRAPLSEGGPRNFAEAAGMARASEVLRRIEDGEDPSRIEPVRPFIISSALTQVSALEAAVATRRIELVQMIDRLGALREPQMRQHLACLAGDLGIDDIVEYFAADASPCRRGATIDAMRARAIETGGS